MHSIPIRHRRQPFPGLARHVRLLLRCAGSRPGDPVPVDAAVDWDRFAALVAHHGLGPHVHAAIGADAFVPPLARAALAALHKQASSYSMLLTARLLQLVAAFQRAGVPLVALKGPALAQQVYGDPALRDSLDLDLLVPAARAESAAAVLRAEGYVLESPLAWLGFRRLAAMRHEATFRDRAGTGVDLHWAVAAAGHPFGIGEARVWSSTGVVEIAGRPVPVLAPDCQLVYLAVHGTAHAWTRLRWLCDVAMLMSAHALDWGRVREIAAEGRSTRALGLSLVLAHDLLGAAVPDDLLRDALADAAVTAAAAEVTHRLTAVEPQPQPTAGARTWFTARLAPTPWARARHVAALMQAPTDAEAEMIRLPRPLVLLYYPLRVVRLAAKYCRPRVAG